MFKARQEVLKLKHILTNRVSSSAVITVKIINDTLRRKSKGVLVQAFLRMLGPIGLKHTAYRTRVILRFIKRCRFLYIHRGMKGLAIYLKASQVLFQQSLGGMRLKDTSELNTRVSRNRAGMPRIVDSQLRQLIRQEDTNVMRFIMTLFALYRVLEFPGKLKLKTITDGFKGNMAPGTMYWRLIAHIPNFVMHIKSIQRENRVPFLAERGITPVPIIKSAPGVAGSQISTTPLILLLSARALQQKGLDSALLFFMKFFEKGTKVPFPGFIAIFQSAMQVPLDVLPSMANWPIGRLGLKHEPGKIRVFAMVDAWTQWALEPFHSWIFDTLRHIEEDGTFDQLRPLRTKVGKVASAFSLDLSAATDRLPMSIQIELVKHLVSKDFAVEWARLLVSREYILPENRKLGIPYSVLKYSVGQPMGALSSWAMLAITHHLLVQVAAWEAGYAQNVWFKEYAVLGDDLVIFCPKVKRQYLLIVDAIGVECGIAKSLLSHLGMVVEFAKRTFYKDVDISPIPMTEFLSANYYLADAISFARKFKLSFPALLRVLGYGKTVRGSVNKYIGSLNSRVRALLFAYYLPVDDNEVQANLLKGNPYLTQSQIETVLGRFKIFMMENYQNRVRRLAKAFPATPVVIKRQADLFRESVLKRMSYYSFLETLISRILPNQGVTSVSTEVRPWEVWFDWTASDFQSAVKTGPAKFTLKSEGELPTVLRVPPSLFNSVEQFILLLDLLGGRLVKMLVETPMSNYRKSLNKLSYSIDAIRYGRSPFAIYSSILQNLQALNKAGDGQAHMFRPLEKPLRFGVDAAQLKLWREFTRVLLIVLNEQKDQNKSKE